MSKTGTIKFRVPPELEDDFDAAVSRAFGLPPSRRDTLRKRSSVLRKLVERFIREEAERHRMRSKGERAS